MGKLRFLCYAVMTMVSAYASVSHGKYRTVYYSIFYTYSERQLIDSAFPYTCCGGLLIYYALATYLVFNCVYVATYDSGKYSYDSVILSASIMWYIICEAKNLFLCAVLTRVHGIMTTIAERSRKGESVVLHASRLAQRALSVSRSSKDVYKRQLVYIVV